LLILYKEFYMKKTGFAWGTLVIGMAFSLALAGCGSAPQAGGGGGASVAADLVPALGGKAKVEGGAVVLTDTVVLTEYVRLQTTLIVPSGVTLDLMAEGAALELQDGAVLTVDGTVNALGHGDHGKGWVEGSLRIGNGAAVINGSGTIYLKSKGRLLNIGSDQALRQLTLDGVTLVGLEDNDYSLVDVHNGGELVLKSGKITGNTFISDERASGGGVNVYKGMFTMEGGEISGNSANGKEGASGGGVNISKGTFTMSDGAISGNTVVQSGSGGSAHGGGVQAGGESVFTMTGGAISGNSTGRWGSEISGNKAGLWGGGVVVQNGSTFIMKGGTIVDNIAPRHSGGVRVDGNSTFIMEGGAISGNTAGESGGVRVDGAFTMTGGRIQGGTASDGFAANTSTDNSNRSDAALSASTAKWGTGGTYTKGGVPQGGGSDIGNTSDTLIAVPAQ
jgi:hypothetical protein